MGLRVNTSYQWQEKKKKKKETKKRGTFLKICDVTLGGFLSINCEGHGFVSRQDG